MSDTIENTIETLKEMRLELVGAGRDTRDLPRHRRRPSLPDPHESPGVGEDDSDRRDPDGVGDREQSGHPLRVPLLMEKKIQEARYQERRSVYAQMERAKEMEAKARDHYEDLIGTFSRTSGVYIHSATSVGEMEAMGRLVRSIMAGKRNISRNLDVARRSLNSSLMEGDKALGSLDHLHVENEDSGV